MRSTSALLAVTTRIGSLAVSGLRSHPAADLEPRHLRQHQIEHQQIRRAASNPIERLGAVARLFDREALLRQIVAQQFADVGLVLDDAEPSGGRVRGWASAT